MMQHNFKVIETKIDQKIENRQKLEWSSEVIDKIKSNPRAGQESPLKLWWLQQQAK